MKNFHSRANCYNDIFHAHLLSRTECPKRARMHLQGKCTQGAEKRSTRKPRFYSSSSFYSLIICKSAVRTYRAFARPHAMVLFFFQKMWIDCPYIKIYTLKLEFLDSLRIREHWAHNPTGYNLSSVLCLPPSCLWSFVITIVLMYFFYSRIVKTKMTCLYLSTYQNFS